MHKKTKFIALIIVVSAINLIKASWKCPIWGSEYLDPYCPFYDNNFIDDIPELCQAISTVTELDNARWILRTLVQFLQISAITGKFITAVDLSSQPQNYNPPIDICALCHKISDYDNPSDQQQIVHKFYQVCETT